LSEASQKTVQVNNLSKYFEVRQGVTDRLLRKKKLLIRAVDGVSFYINNNETLGLVGESGSGKTTLGRTVLMLERPTSGEIIFDEDIARLNEDKLHEKRKLMQIVFQNPASSLDPRHRVKDILSEPLKAFGRLDENSYSRLVSVLKVVGLPEESLTRFPHEFSGGQKQRIAIARALVLDPKLLVLDEPTSALDSSVQAQVLNLLQSIQKERQLSFLFITHNVNVVKYMADRIAVMHNGKIVETGKTKDVIENPSHPYTISLISSVPKPDPSKKVVIGEDSTEAQSSIVIPLGCRYNPKCPYVEERCRTEEPKLREFESEHYVACHFAENIREISQASGS